MNNRKTALKTAIEAQSRLINNSEETNSNRLQDSNVQDSQDSDAILDEIYKTLEDWNVPEI